MELLELLQFSGILAIKIINFTQKCLKPAPRVFALNGPLILKMKSLNHSPQDMIRSMDSVSELGPSITPTHQRIVMLLVLMLELMLLVLMNHYLVRNILFKNNYLRNPRMCCSG